MFVKDSDKFVSEVFIDNTFGQNVSGTIFCAGYNTDSKLESCTDNEYMISEGEKCIINIEGNDSDIKKIMMWDSQNEMLPHIESLVYTTK